MSEMLSTISKVHAEKRRSERSADEFLPKRFELCTGHKRVQEQAWNVWKLRAEIFRKSHMYILCDHICQRSISQSNLRHLNINSSV